MKIKTSVYHVFSGIDFIYIDSHTESLDLNGEDKNDSNILEIIHCREGRLEQIINDEFIYLSPGDIAIVKPSQLNNTYFPLKHYHGLTIRINLDKTPNCLSCLLDDVNVKPKAICEKFCKKNGGFISRANEAFEHIFSELYSIPPEIQKGYFKIKTLELLLYLSVLDINQDELQKRVYSKNNVWLAKSVSNYLLENMDERITLYMLSQRFHMSGTHIKNIFKGVYGVTIGSYVKTQKMESAAYMLEYTDKSILEISGLHGYDNCSKFACAFRSVKGVNPTEYRSNLLNKNNICLPN